MCLPLLSSVSHSADTILSRILCCVVEIHLSAFLIRLICWSWFTVFSTVLIYQRLDVEFRVSPSHTLKNYLFCIIGIFTWRCWDQIKARRRTHTKVSPSPTNELNRIRKLKNTFLNQFLLLFFVYFFIFAANVCNILFFTEKSRPTVLLKKRWYKCGCWIQL